MIIRQLKLTNFRQYRNEKINFATDPIKNVTVILGENTHGKTTLVCSFLWCLYRDFGLSGPIFSSETAAEMNPGDEGVAEVMMTLEHNGSEYRVTTKQIFKKTQFGIEAATKARTTLVKDGKGITDPQIVNREIQFILKQDVKDYFFYDGENNRIESVGKKSSLKSAIYQMMGIDMVVDIAKFFNPSASGAIASKLNSQLVVDPTPELDMLKAQQTKLQLKRDDIQIEIENKQKEIDKLEEQRADKERILSENKGVETDQRRKIILENQIRTNQMKVDSRFSEVISSISGKQFSSLQQILYAKTYKKFNLDKLAAQSSFSKKESLSHIDEKVIDQLIERGRCLCGAIITDSNDARRHLEEAREHMEPHDYGRYLSDFCNRMRIFVDNEDQCHDRISTSADDFLNLVENIENCKTEILEIEERIKDRPDVGKIQEQISSIKSQIARHEAAIEIDEKRELPRLDREILEITDKIQKLAKKNGNNELIERCINYMNIIHSTAAGTVTKKKNEIRTELEKQVNEIFTFIYHGERVVKIDDDFNIITELKDGERLSASGGTESVKNFSFVAGLIKLVKRHILSEGGSLFTYDKDDRYPLVMDAPFSGVDAEHTKNVCKILPEYCDQVIIVLLENAYRDAEETLEGKVGKIYRINKLNEKCSEIREEE